jgi:hypothetical protein
VRRPADPGQPVALGFDGAVVPHARRQRLGPGDIPSLAQEVAAFGIKVTLIEPGGYATDWGGSSAVSKAAQGR